MKFFEAQQVIDHAYFEQWKSIIENPELKFFNWGMMDGSQYATIEPVVVDEFWLETLKNATEACGQIYRKAVHLVMKDTKLLSLLGIHPDAHEYCKSRYDEDKPVTLIGRFDFALNRSGELKLLEFNSDTPTGVVEAGELNGLIAKFAGKKDPNQRFRNNLKDAFQMFVASKVYHNVVFTSLDWHEEDKGTTLFEMECSGLSAKYISLEHLTVSSGVLMDDRGQKIDLLYRLYPIEWFVLEQEGIKLLRLVAEGSLDMLNPPSAFVAQSKVMMAIIWEMANHTNFFNVDEKEIVKQYFLPTYLDESYFKGRAYVKKPAYAREGGGVSLYNERGACETSVVTNEMCDDMIYQQRIDLPLQTVKTWSGSCTGRLVIGCFLVGGRFSGVYQRLGEAITSDISYFIPMVYG